MSQHILRDEENREWLVGYDNPCGGFFATRFVSDEEAEETGIEADVVIGFGRGVDLLTLDRECQSHGLELSKEMLVQLSQDGEEEGAPRTPLQDWVHTIFDQMGALDAD